MNKLPGLFLLLLPLWGPSLGAQQVPRKARDWTIQVPDGKPITLAAYRGKPVVLAFILTTCPHCQHAVELLSKIQPDYAPRGLAILASAIDSNAASALPLFLRYMHPPFPVGFNEAMAVLAFADYPAARLPHMPIMLFIDRQGVVRQQHEGGDQAYFDDQEEQNLRSSIDALVAPAKPVGKTAAAAKKTN